METQIGTKGLSNSWQNDFPEETECECGKIARIAFVTQEAHEEKGYVCDLHENKPKEAFWPHDAIAVAVYFCKKCFKAVALWNQA